MDDATRTLPARDVEFASPLGYQTPAEFYAPAYATEKARRSMVPDYRTTLYWNPTVKLDDTGQASVEFYTPPPRAGAPPGPGPPARPGAARPLENAFGSFIARSAITLRLRAMPLALTLPINCE